MWRRTSSKSSNTSSPATSARPDDAGMNPVRMRIVVLLPAPSIFFVLVSAGSVC
jgi:hypothetical protein